MKKILQVLFLSYILLLSGCSETISEESKSIEKQEEMIHKEEVTKKETSSYNENIETIKVATLPPYSGTPYIEINNNVPEFETYEIQEATTSYETYSQLDNLGRCQEAQASIGQDLMPNEDRESLGSVTPSGWDNEQYSCVDGGWIYNL